MRFEIVEPRIMRLKMNTKPGNGPMLTRKEAAKYLGCSESFLAKKAVNEPGLIPYVKIGRYVQYRQSDLDAFIASRKH